MDNNNRPGGRKRNVTGKAGPIQRKGSGLGTGPVGNGRPDNFPDKPEPIFESRRTGTGRTVKRGGALSLVAIAALLLFGGGNLFGGSEETVTYQTPVPTAYVASTPAPTPKPQSTSAPNYGISPASFTGSSTVTQTTDTNTEAVDTTVAKGSRAKRTVIRGDGND